MKRFFFIIIITSFCWAKTWAEECAYNPAHENVLSVRYGGIWIQDQYLTPLLYSGQQVSLANEWWQDFRHSSTRRWQHLGKFETSFGWLYNQAYTNLLYILALQGGWGACYNWHFPDYGLRLKLGPYMGIDCMGKRHATSVNKPYSIDLAINLCAMGGLEWAFRANKTTYRLRYIARMNMIGMDYVPDYWHSYYEMGEGVLGNFRCAGMWNHRHLQHELTFDMQFKRSTWRVGIQHEYLEYGERNMLFSREMVSAVIGCVWDYRVSAAKDLTKW